MYTEDKYKKYNIVDWLSLHFSLLKWRHSCFCQLAVNISSAVTAQCNWNVRSKVHTETGETERVCIVFKLMQI